MKDRFKFRVWCKNKNEWEKDCILGVNGNLSSVYGCEQFTANGLSIKCIILNPENHIIEQCTGLKDKNGKLIYEGDILKNPDFKCLYFLFWDKNLAKFRLSWQHEEEKYNCDFQRDDRYEIIGNIHENF